MKTLVLIDGHALVHRAYHALPPLNTNKGELVNAVFGFVSILLKVIKEMKPDYLIATFDLAKPTFRHKEFADYQATRPKAPDELYAQIKRVKEVLAAFNVPVFEKEGYEADDVIGSLAKHGRLRQLADKIIIVTGDLDTLQLIDDKVNIFTLKKGIKDTILYDAKAVMERYGLSPEQITDFKGLKGDPSDNIPGVPGVGEKIASDLLKKFGSMEKLYDFLEEQAERTEGKFLKSKPPSKNQKLFEKLLEFKEQAFFSKYLATIKCDVPLPIDAKKAQARNFDKAKVITLFKDLGFYSLIDRLPQNELALETKKETESAKKESQDLTEEKIKQAFGQGVLSRQLYEVEMALAPVLRQMEKNGVKIDEAHLKKLGKCLNKRIAELEKDIYRLAGLSFNINSSQQLSEVLFGKLGAATKGLKKTPGRVISTAAPELAKLRGSHEIIDFVLEYRELRKLKTTYVDALPKLTGSDGRLRTTFDQLGATTGRLASKNPNLQNIPVKTELGREIRKAFVAEEGYKLLKADYSQIELRIVASIANDVKMIKALREGHDIHTLTAAEVFEVPQDKVTLAMRKAAKALNFGVIYGMSMHGFAQAAGIELGKAKNFIKKYFEEFAGVARYIEKTKDEVAKKGYAQTLFGRKRFIPEIQSSVWNLRQAAERMAVNAPIQGTAADLIKMAMVDINAKLKTQNSKLLLQVHDELIFEVPEGKIAEVAAEVKKIMENIYKLAAPLKVEMEVGDNWGELVGLEVIF